MANSTHIDLPYHWAPRPGQEALWDYLQEGGTRASVCWHRRYGKDEVGLHYTACAMHKRVGSYWHMLPEKEQARKAIWTMVNPHTGKRRIDEAFPLALRRRTQEQEMMIEFRNGSTWQIAGSDNYNSLVGSSPCGIVFSEYALADPASWAYLRPILRENKGWALFISTPRGKNHFYNLHQHALKAPDWFAQTLTVEDTQALTPEELATDLAELQAEHGDQYGKSIWLQENYCSFDAAIPGAIWADCLDRAQMTGRIRDYDIDRSQPVSTAWDLGRTDDTAIWWYQFVGSEIRIFDHFSAPGMDIDNEDEPDKGLIQLLIRLQERYQFTYATHWLPHDARPRTQAAGGKSILQQFHDATKRLPQLGKVAIVKRLDVQEGIQAARKTFARCHFHATKCAIGLAHLRHYHREWDSELQTYADHPQHDFCLADETKILTRHGMYQIMDLPPTGEVMTLCGWKPYHHPRITRQAAPLVAVQFSDGTTVRCTPDHFFLTENGWRFAKDLLPNMPILSCWTHSHNTSMGVSTVFGRVRSIFRKVVVDCIEMCGLMPSVTFQMDAISTIGMGSQDITHSAIWNACHGSSIFQTPCAAEQFSISEIISARKRGSKLQNGISLTKGDFGIGGILPNTNHGKNGSVFQRFVHHVVSPFKDLNETGSIHKSIAASDAKPLTIVSVRPLSDTADVWCITVPSVEHYALANGAISHNSSHSSDAFRYLSLSWKQVQPEKPESPIIDKLFEHDPIHRPFKEHVDRFLKRRRLAKQELSL